MTLERRRITGMNVVEAIEMANKVESPEPTQTDLNGNLFIKAIIISLTDDGAATHSTRRLLKSIRNTHSYINPLVMDASTPDTARDGLISISHRDFSNARWTWPIEDRANGLDIATGLYRKKYEASDHRKVIACMVSHMRAWQHCIDMNEPIMVLEQDALFIRQFSWHQIENPRPLAIDDEWWNRWLDTREMSVLPWDIKDKWKNMHESCKQKPEGKFSGGILGLNSPIGATRKSSIFHGRLFGKHGFHKVPSVDTIGDDPLPQGLAGNSAYIIKPWAAKKLLDKVDEIGMWPNDALMCKQFFPWMQVIWPYYTVVQGGPSSTTG